MNYKELRVELLFGFFILEIIQLLILIKTPIN